MSSRTPITDWNTLPVMMTVEEAAEALNVSRNGAYDLVANGTIPAVKLGRRVRIPRDRLRQMIEQTEAADR